MFVIPLFATAWILVLGPGTIEKGIPAINAKGFKPAIEQALKEGKPLKVSKTGNFGND